MSILKGIFHRYNKSTKEYDTVHLETETAQITDFAEGIVKKLAATTAMSVVSAMSTDSWFANLMKLVLTASGVKYSVGTIGYVCLGSLFGGVIIQWGTVKIEAGNLTSGAYTFPIAYTKTYIPVGVHVAADGNDIIGVNATSLTSLYFKRSSISTSGTFTIGFITVGS